MATGSAESQRRPGVLHGVQAGVARALISMRYRASVPIGWLRAAGLIAREVEALDRQLRLPFGWRAEP